MGFIKEYRNLQKQKRAAYSDMQEKRNHIMCTGYDITTQDDVCLKLSPFPVFGVLFDSGITQTLELDHCGMFYNNDYCTNLGCRMCRKNHEFIDSVKVYQSIKAAQRNLVKNTMKFKKH